jgi:hypothetical protein
VQARTQQGNAKHKAAQYQSKLISKQATTSAQSHEPRRHEPTLEAERILMVDLTAT